MENALRPAGQARQGDGRGALSGRRLALRRDAGGADAWHGAGGADGMAVRCAHYNRGQATTAFRLGYAVPNGSRLHRNDRSAFHRKMPMQSKLPTRDDTLEIFAA